MELQTCTFLSLVDSVLVDNQLSPQKGSVKLHILISLYINNPPVFFLIFRKGIQSRFISDGPTQLIIRAGSESHYSDTTPFTLITSLPRGRKDSSRKKKCLQKRDYVYSYPPWPTISYNTHCMLHPRRWPPSNGGLISMPLSVFIRCTVIRNRMASRPLHESEKKALARKQQKKQKLLFSSLSFRPSKTLEKEKTNKRSFLLYYSHSKTLEFLFRIPTRFNPLSLSRARLFRALNRPIRPA